MYKVLPISVWDNKVNGETIDYEQAPVLFTTDTLADVYDVLKHEGTRYLISVKDEGREIVFAEPLEEFTGKTTSTPEPICPHCGSTPFDPKDIEKDKGFESCWNCSGNIRYVREYIYSTYKEEK